LSTQLVAPPQTTERKGPFADLSVYGVMADDGACGHYRIKYPLDYLAKGGARVGYGQGFTGEDLSKFDVILAQRQYDPRMFRLLMQMKDLGKLIIYELDDNVMRVEPSSPAFETFFPNSVATKRVQEFMRHCDGFFTTSPEMAAAFSPYAKRSWVVPNSIDLCNRDWASANQKKKEFAGKVIVGWAGSITHNDDWQPLIGHLSRVIKKYDNVVFAVASAQRVTQRFANGLEIPKDKLHVMEPVDLKEYPQLINFFDIGLIPVMNTPFNQCKSNLKVLEYGAWGIPYVASKVAPYVRFHEETGGRGGYLCNNAYEWEQALSRLIEDEQERQEKSTFLKRYIRTECTYEARAGLWAQAIREAKEYRQIELAITRSPENTLIPQPVRKYQVTHRPGRNDQCPCDSGKKYKKCCHPAWGA
jgi:glycosyltransferase involved in cell wall biosynthesis